MKITPYRIKKGISVPCNPKVLFQMTIGYPGFFMFSAISFHQVFDLARRRCICQTELPIVIGLSPDGIQHFQQVSLWRLITGDHDADQRTAGKFLYLPRLSFGIAGNTNAGIALAEGTWIGLLDHDDLLAPEALYEVVAVINQEPEAEARGRQANSFTCLACLFNSSVPARYFSNHGAYGTSSGSSLSKSRFQNAAWKSILL